MPKEFFPSNLRGQEGAETEYDFIEQLGNLYVNLLKCSRSPHGTHQLDAARALQGLVNAIDLAPKTPITKAVDFASRRVCWNEEPRMECDQYGPNGPHELTRLVEEEVPTKEYFRVRRADMRYIGRRVWTAFERMLLAGGRHGQEWQALKDDLRRANGSQE